MLRCFGFLMVLLLCSGCDGIPKDPDGTLDRIAEEGVFRAGVISAHPPVGLESQNEFLRRVAIAGKAKPLIEAGASEVLLDKLKAGHLDLVVGQLSPESPWAKDVALLPPIFEQVTGESHVLVSVAAPNGENEWVALLHREARAAREASR